MNPILLDTHALLWFAEGSLSERAATDIVAASAENALLLSPVSAWEIGLLVARGRLRLDRPVRAFVDAIYSRPGFVVASMTPAVAVESTTLPGDIHADPADRILVASAIAYRAMLMTRDAKLHAYAKATKAFATLPC